MNELTAIVCVCACVFGGGHTERGVAQTAN